jgi:PAS domain S-box-containing protein
MPDETTEPTPAGDAPTATAVLWDATERLRALEEAAPVGIVALDQDGRVTIWNRAAERLFGWRPSEVMGRPNPLIPGDRQTESVALRARVLQGEALSGIETYRQRKDGSLMMISLSTAPIRDAEGRVCGTMNVLTDISETKRLEQQFLQAQKMEAIGQLAGGIAHDFNNLLTAIIGYSDLVLDRVRDQPDIAADVEEIRKVGERASCLTHQLLAFSRRQLLMPQVLDLNQVVRDFNKMLSRVISDDIRFDIVAAPSLGRTRADLCHLEQLLMNLVVNARDAMPQGGTLTIETANAVLDSEFVRRHMGSEPGHYVSLTVKDTGCGMAPEVVAHVFEPFFTTKGPAKGTGLGLSTTYGIVRQSGGYITVESTPGVGTSFTIYLPRVDDLIESAGARAPSVTTLQGTETILLVEDEPSVRALIGRMLEGYGYAVLQARDVFDAIAIAEGPREPIHLLVSDIIMPGLNGPALAQRLVRRRPAIKVLYVSGFANQVALPLGSINQSASFLQKPFAAATLATKVRECLDHQVGQAG